MKNTLTILLCIPLLFFSCKNDHQKNKIDSNMSNIIMEFSVTSKNAEVTSRFGKDVGIDEMTTINVKSGDKILFKNIYFTLDNKINDGLNFHSDNGRLMCTAPTKLSIMSMPPNGDGFITYAVGDIFEISGTTLIKINSINFVISNTILK